MEQGCRDGVIFQQCFSSFPVSEVDARVYLPGNVFDLVLILPKDQTKFLDT
jgi:hypothetical protein